MYVHVCEFMTVYLNVQRHPESESCFNRAVKVKAEKINVRNNKFNEAQ